MVSSSFFPIPNGAGTGRENSREFSLHILFILVALFLFRRSFAGTALVAAVTALAAKRQDAENQSVPEPRERFQSEHQALSPDGYPGEH